MAAIFTRGQTNKWGKNEARGPERWIDIQLYFYSIEISIFPIQTSRSKFPVVIHMPGGKLGDYTYLVIYSGRRASRRRRHSSLSYQCVAAPAPTFPPKPPGARVAITRPVAWPLSEPQTPAKVSCHKLMTFLYPPTPRRKKISQGKMGSN